MNRRAWLLAWMCAGLLLGGSAGAETGPPRHVVHPGPPVRTAAHAAPLPPDDAARARLYLAPRAYPRSTIDPKSRVLGLTRLFALYDTLGLHYFPAVTLTSKLTKVVSPGPCIWHSAGPTNLAGRVTGLAVDPTNPKRMFASTVGGVWRTLDQAESWDRVSDGLGAFCTGAVAIAPDQPNLVIAGQGDPNRFEAAWGSPTPSLMVSASGGDPGAWTRTGSPQLEGAIVTRIRIGPGTNPTVYVASSTGVFRGNMSSATWGWVQVGNMDAPCSDLVVDFRDPTAPVLYAGVRGAGASIVTPGVYKCTDSATGNGWARLGAGFPDGSGQVGLALFPGAPGETATLYARVCSGPDAEGNGGGAFLGIYRKRGTGAWTLKPAKLPDGDNPDDSGGYSYYNCMIEVSPIDRNTVYTSGVHLYRTTNADATTPTWTDVTDQGGLESAYTRTAPHADQHALIFAPGQPDVVWLGNDGGIDLSTDLSLNSRHWEDRAHGMTTTEFYTLATQREAISAVAGGSQDNGNALTFGNSTWYPTNLNCDGATVALDPGPSCTMYEFCLDLTCETGSFIALANPVPYVVPIQPTLPQTTAGLNAAPPIVLDSDGHGLMGSCPTSAGEQLLVMTDGQTWNPVAGLVLPDAADQISALAVDPQSGFNAWYLGFRGSPNVSASSIWCSADDGATWTTPRDPIPDLSPNAIVADPTRLGTAYAALGGAGGGRGSVIVTRNFGFTWSELAGPGSEDVFSTAATGVVMDKSTPGALYVSTEVGVFGAALQFGSSDQPPSARWFPLSDGLPYGVDVTSLTLEGTSGRLAIGTMGYGAYEIDPLAHLCPPVELSIRDNVFDDGDVPSPFAAPDPEHPVPSSRLGSDMISRPFFEAAGEETGALFWWNSPDIRIHDLKASGSTNELAWADNVNVESCPIEAVNCPPGLNIDARPVRGAADTVYVQVRNRGTRVAHDVHVMALWADASTGLPNLPTDFWTTDFPASGECPPHDLAGGWHELEPPCITLAEVPPDQTVVATFKWVVPGDAPDHSCMLALAENADDTIPGRTSNELDLSNLVPQNRQVGQRNLQVVDATAMTTMHTAAAETLWIGNPGSDTTGITLYFSREGLPSGALLALLLPADSVGTLNGIARVPTTLIGPIYDRAQSIGADTGALYVVNALQSRIFNFRVRPHDHRTIGLVYDANLGTPLGTAARFTVTSRQGLHTLGGCTYVLRGGKP